MPLERTAALLAKLKAVTVNMPTLQRFGHLCGKILFDLHRARQLLLGDSDVPSTLIVIDVRLAMPGESFNETTCCSTRPKPRSLLHSMLFFEPTSTSKHARVLHYIQKND